MRTIITALIIMITLANIVLANDKVNKLIREHDPELKQGRIEWIDQMHRTAPGVDWRILEAEQRYSKNKAREERIKMLKNNHPSIMGNEEIIADGRIKGFWQERGSSNQSGRIMTADIDFESNYIYAISAGGNVWRGTIEGRNWQCLNDRQKFEGNMIRIMRFDGKKRILVSSNRTVLYSDDEGNTWNEADGFDNLKRWGSVKRAVVANDGNETIYLLAHEWDYDEWKARKSVYISRNRGETFEKIMYYDINTDRMDIWAPRYYNNSVFFMHEDSIFTITPDGSFNLKSQGSIELPTSNMNQIQKILLKGTVVDGFVRLVAALRTSTDRYVYFYVSDDDGKTWDPRWYVEFGPFNNNSFNVSPKDINIMHFGGVEFYTSRDGARRWVRKNGWGEYYGDPENLLHADIPAVDVFLHDNQEITLISTDGGLYISYDQVQTVKNLSLNGLNVSQYYSVLSSKSDTNIVYAGAQDQGFQRSNGEENGVYSFDQTITGDYGHITSSDGGHTLWTVYPGFAMNFQNAETYMDASAWSFEGTNWMWMPYTLAVPGLPNMALCAAGSDSEGAKLWLLSYENNYGIRATKFDYNFCDTISRRIASIGISPNNTDYIYVVSDDGIFFSSSNAGDGWMRSHDFEDFEGHYFYGSSIAVSAESETKVIVAGYSDTQANVWLTNDGGETFTAMNTGLPSTLVYDIAMTEDEEMIFAATSIGPYVFIKHTDTWYDLSGVAAPDQTYWTVEYLDDRNIARFGTYGRGIWDFNLTFFDPEVSVAEEQIVPSLNISASPNPISNGKTQISVNSSMDTRAEIKIIDLEGRVVCQLFEGYLTSGISNFSWDGKTDSGIKLPSGAYLAIITAAGNISYIKLIIE